MKTHLITTSRLSLLLALGVLLGGTVVSAEIISDDFGGTPRTYSFGTTQLSTDEVPVVDLDLPGWVKATVLQFYYDKENFFQINSVDVKQKLVGSFYYAASAEANETWSDVSSNATNGWGNISTLNLVDYSTEHLRGNPTYIPFRFEDTSDSNALKYGYMACSTELTGSGVDSVLTLTIYSYAYETDGSEIAMGAINLVLRSMKSRLSSSDLEAYHYLGGSVSMDGDVAILGATSLNNSSS